MSTKFITLRLLFAQSSDRKMRKMANQSKLKKKKNMVVKSQNYAAKYMLKTNCWTKEMRWYKSVDILINFSCVIYHQTNSYLFSFISVVLLIYLFTYIYICTFHLYLCMFSSTYWCRMYFHLNTWFYNTHCTNDWRLFSLVQSAVVVEYTDCFTAERSDPPPIKCPIYDTKQSDGEFPVMLELWGTQSTPLLPSLPGPLWPRVVAPDKIPIYGLNRMKPWFLGFTLFCI